MVVLLLASCLKPAPPTAAASPVPVSVAVVLASYDHPEVTPAPDRVDDAIAAELTRRNLVPTTVEVGPPFTAARSTDARLTLLPDGARLLVECAPRFDAQVNGRYRWTVAVDATIDAGRGSTGASRAFSVPVHLSYDHEREPEALSDAAPIGAREIGRLLDDWVASGAGAASTD
ncbi:MAG: hypothetical protein ABMB14_10215 [Myxococcota bacterium]